MSDGTVRHDEQEDTTMLVEGEDKSSPPPSAVDSRRAEKVTADIRNLERLIER